MAVIVLQPRAKADLSEIWEFIADDSNDQADAFIDLIDQKFQLLAHQVGLGRRRVELAEGLRSFAVGRYVISISPFPLGFRSCGCSTEPVTSRLHSQSRKPMNDRKHLSGREFERLLEAVKGSRNEIRDRCLVLLMLRHGLRVSEACFLVLEQVDIESRVLHVARLKGGLSTTHPLRGDEIRAIKAWLVERSRMKAPGRSFFLSEQRKPLHRSTVILALRKYGEKAKLPVAVHPHMLRHA